MINKLPEELRRIITRHFKGGVWQFEELMKFQEEVEARERCNSISRHNRGIQDHKEGEPLLPSSAAALITPQGGGGASNAPIVVGGTNQLHVL